MLLLSGAKTTEKEMESNKKVDARVKHANDKIPRLRRYEAAKWTALKDAFEQSLMLCPS